MIIDCTKIARVNADIVQTTGVPAKITGVDSSLDSSLIKTEVTNVEPDEDNSDTQLALWLCPYSTLSMIVTLIVVLMKMRIPLLKMKRS